MNKGAITTPRRCEAPLHIRLHPLYWCFNRASTFIIDKLNCVKKPSATASTVTLTSLSYLLLILAELLSQNSGPLQWFNAYLKAVCSRALC